MRERVKSLLGTLSEKYFVSGPKQWLAENQAHRRKHRRYDNHCQKDLSCRLIGTVPVPSSKVLGTDNRRTRR